MRSRLTVFALVVSLIACLTAGLCAGSMLKDGAISSTHAELDNEAVALSTILAGRSDDDAREALRSVAVNENMRIQLIQADGTVIADTRTLSGNIMLDTDENPEIAEAFTGKNAYRLSGEGSTDMMYVAVPFSDTLVLRVLKSMATVYKNVDSRIRVMYM